MNKRNGKAQGGHTEIRTLPIKLPANHPIFQYPDGERSKVAREWIDRGRDVMETLQEIKALIAALNITSEENRHYSAGKEKRIIDGEKKSGINPSLFIDL